MNPSDADLPPVSRRQLLRLVAAAGAGALVGGCRRGIILTDTRELATAALTDPRSATALAHLATPVPERGKSTPRPAPAPRELGVDSDVHLTAVEDFYTMKYNPSAPPVVDPNAYRLVVDGLVAAPLSLSLADIGTLGRTTLMRTLECISNPAGGDLIGNAVWQGVRFADVLARAGMKPTGKYLKLTSADGYHTGIPIELALDPRAFLVDTMNGVPLPAAHGFPLRCLFPGHYGQKQPKWLTGITVQDTPHVGHWESAGWSNTAEIQINSRIDGATRPRQVGEPVVAHGIAFSDLSGVARVVIEVDRSGSYPVTVVRRAPAPFTELTWTEWEWTWADPPPGSHVLEVRAADGNGISQHRPRANLLGGTFPDGTSDMHKITVQVPGA